MTFLLLGTDGCHLCEDAQTLLDENQIVVEYVDIALHEEWQSQFASLIPILFHVESQRFLNWRFDSPALFSFIESLKYDESIIESN
jgi:glutaredoxin